jgi:hypothetical protein
MRLNWSDRPHPGGSLQRMAAALWRTPLWSPSWPTATRPTRLDPCRSKMAWAIPGMCSASCSEPGNGNPMLLSCGDRLTVRPGVLERQLLNRAPARRESRSCSPRWGWLMAPHQRVWQGKVDSWRSAVSSTRRSSSAWAASRRSKGSRSDWPYAPDRSPWAWQRVLHRGEGPGGWG